MPQKIDTDKLSSMIKSKRGSIGLRKTAEDIKISAPTLSRIEQGNLPDIETYLKICEWLGVSADYFSTSKEDEGSTKNNIVASLRADKTLPSETVEALIEMINLAYNQVKKTD